MKFWTKNITLTLPESQQGWGNHRKNIRKDRELSIYWILERYTANCSPSRKHKSHKYQVFNEQLHWPKILIYLEFHCHNLSQIVLKICLNNITLSHNLAILISQYSLHCAVKHIGSDTLPYVYHLSDEMTHDFNFTSTANSYLLEVDKPSTIHFKSDNYAAQYKNKCLFK